MHLTLDMIMRPVAPDYQECARCGIRLGGRPTVKARECGDCVNIHTVRGNYLANRGSLVPDPAFEVTIHSETIKQHDPTVDALVARKIPFEKIFLYKDKVAEAYIREELGAEAPVVVLVTNYGRYVTHWEGFRPDILDGLLAMREQYLGTTQELEMAA